MEFTLTINMDNTAFENPDEEVRRIISTIPIIQADYAASGPLLDINGNTVGKWSIS